jgi:hypothetical protein
MNASLPNPETKHILGLAYEAGIDVFRDRYLHDHKGAIRELKDRFYPDAGMFGSDSEGRPNSTYRVVCSTPAELALAYALKPADVNAHIILETPVQH